MSVPVRNPASFRDPNGFVFHENGRVRRAITEQGLAHARAVRATGLITRLIGSGRLLPEEEVPAVLEGCADVRLILEHPTLPFISYPYEWSFRSLQAAALLHLDIQLEALDAGVMLTDASAYNVQFIGMQPVFIDHLSFRPYVEGELWAAHRQFCDQFLHPLLLQSLVGVPFQSWYRGSIEGISAEHLARLLRFRHKLDWNVLANVVFPARLQRVASRPAVERRVRHGVISRAALREMLMSLHRWIGRLEPDNATATATTWHGYDETVPEHESQAIAGFVRETVHEVRPHTLWDLGCNGGRYSEVALAAGARYAVGFDNDIGALDRAVLRAREKKLALLPLLVDLVNPSPAQGWGSRERAGLLDRGRPDALLALSVVHHMAIARNVPLAEIAGLVTRLSPHGIIGFVPHTDARAQALFRGREEIFQTYTFDNFVTLLRRHARIVVQRRVPHSDRILLRFSTS